MPSLSSYLNVYNTCLVILQRWGFKLSYDKAADAWFAEKGDFTLRGDNPIELIGLAAIYNEVQPRVPSEYWWKIDDPNLIAKFDEDF